MRKLNEYGIRGGANELMKSYFENRFVYVQISESKSRHAPLLTGIPQDSCLRPLLFIIYINDVVRLSLGSKVIMYADDLVLYNSDYDSDTLNTIANSDLDNIYNYTFSHLLFINELKCKYMIFNKRESISQDCILIESNQLEEEEEFKYFGLTIDRQLKFKTHTLKIISKLNQCNGIISALKGLLPVESL